MDSLSSLLIGKKLYSKVIAASKILLEKEEPLFFLYNSWASVSV